MSSLAELPELVGFFSYSRDDDEDFKGSLSALRDAIQKELRGQLGRNKTNFRLFQDQEAILPGKQWDLEIKNAVGKSVFFIPLITPRSVGSKYCQFEFESFLAREQEIGRNDLIFPILYIPVAALQNEAKWRSDPVLSTVGKRQYVDWRSLRYQDVNTPFVREQIGDFCRKVVEALNEPWVSPEDVRRIEETKARQLAEEQRLKAEARQRAEEEQRQRQSEAEARLRAEQERAEVKRHAAEAESRRKAEAEALERAEKERARKEEEAKRREEQAQEQAFAATKCAGSISAIDTFIASYPESRYAREAQRLRASLMVRDDAFKVAMATDDTATLKVFLHTYPKGTLADQVRGRLRGLEPQRTSRLLLIGCLLGLALIIGYVTWAWVIRTSDDAGWMHSGANTQANTSVEKATSLPAKPEASSATSAMVAPTKPVASSSAADSLPDIITDCDWLAANPSDSQRPKAVPGVAYLEQINVTPALAACKDAVANILISHDFD
jgi:hypothetical protein